MNLNIAFFRSTVNSCVTEECVAPSFLSATSRRYRLFPSIGLLFLLLVSCNESVTLQGRETILEKLKQMEKLMYSRPDSLFSVLDTIWRENETRLTDKEKRKILHQRCMVSLLLEDFETAEEYCSTALKEKRLKIAQQEEVMQFRRIRVIVWVAVLAVICVLFVYIIIYQQNKIRKDIRIVQQGELLAQYKEKECRTISVNLGGAMKKLSDDLLHQFDTEKIYRHPQLKVDDVAQKIGTNSQRLSILLNKKYKISFNDFVNYYRIDEAKEVLRNQDEGGEYVHYTIQAIAEMVGFRSSSSFYSAFRQAVGVTPTEYKEAVRRMKTPESD